MNARLVGWATMPVVLCAVAASQPACTSTKDEPGTGSAADASSPPADGGAGGIRACATDLRPELARLRVPGLAAGIVKNGRLVCTAVAGLANIAQQRPVTPNTIFWWASVSKPVAATAVMSVAQDGAFELDDDVNRYLPFKVRNPNRACAGTPITFRELLTHTSSIVEDESKPAYRDAFVVGKPRQPLGDYVRSYLLPGGRIYNSHTNFLAACPGKRYHYSSLGFGLLGYTVESILHTPFDRISKERIFTPLGMRDTSFALAGLDRSKLAMGYRGRSPSTFKPLGYYEHPNYPDGSLRSSVPDLARFMIMTMQLGKYHGTRILPKATVRQMLRPQIPTLDDTQGLAWYHDRYGARKVIGHDGEDPGATSLLFFDPADRAGVLLVANGQWNEDRAEGVLEKLFRESSRH